MQHLTLHNRQLIEAMLLNGASQAAIARALGVHRSTVNREISRNSVDGKYFADVAAKKAFVRKQMGANLMKLTKLFSEGKAQVSSRKGGGKSRFSLYFYPKYLRRHRKGRFFRRAKDQRKRVRHRRFLHWAFLIEMRFRNKRRIRDFAWEWYRSRFARSWVSYRYKLIRLLAKRSVAKPVEVATETYVVQILPMAWAISLHSTFLRHFSGNLKVPLIQYVLFEHRTRGYPPWALVFRKKISPFYPLIFFPDIFGHKKTTCLSDPIS
ncbi:helix-turn-helix domain-containing protein [Limibacter armeniacum]